MISEFQKIEKSKYVSLHSLPVNTLAEIISYGYGESPFSRCVVMKNASGLVVIIYDPNETAFGKTFNGDNNNSKHYEVRILEPGETVVLRND